MRNVTNITKRLDHLERGRAGPTAMGRIIRSIWAQEYPVFSPRRQRPGLSNHQPVTFDVKGDGSALRLVEDIKDRAASAKPAADFGSSRHRELPTDKHRFPTDPKD